MAESQYRQDDREGGERPLLYFAEAANKELADLRGKLKTHEDGEAGTAYALRIELANAQQNEVNARAESDQLRRRLADTEGEVQHVSEAATCASIQAQTHAEELNLARAALDAERAKQARETEELRRSTADAVHEATQAHVAKQEVDRKLGSIMAGSNAKETELEGALFNAVHECAQLRKDHQDAIDEMAVTMSRQKADYEHHCAQLQGNFDHEVNTAKLDLEVSRTKSEQLEKRVDAFNSMHTSDMALASVEQHKLQMALQESRGNSGVLSQENQSTAVALQNLQLESRMKERENTAALKEAQIERKQLQDAITQGQVRLNHSVQLSETKDQYLREQYERKIAMQQQEHETEIEMLNQQSDLRFEKSEDVAHAASASQQAEGDKKRRELEQLLREANEARKQQQSELEQLKSLLTDQVEHSKKRESVHEHQLEGASKKQERLELEKNTFEQRTQKVSEESDMMRRTLEAALREADTTAKNLREDLERVNRKYVTELNAAREETFVLKEQLTSTKAELDSSEQAREEANMEHYDEINAQKKITERVQLELASSRQAEEHSFHQKQELNEKIRQLTHDRQRLSSELDAERAEHSSTRSELAEAKANAQAIHREKLETCSQLRSQLVQERAAGDSVSHQKELLSVDLRRAAEDRDSARRELALSMRKNMAMNREAEEANQLSEGLKYRMQEVTAAQEGVLGGPTFHPRYTASGASAARLSPRLHAPVPSGRYSS